MNWLILQSQSGTIYDKIGALSGEFSDEKQSSTFLFELSILGGLLLLLGAAYWIASNRIQRRLLVRRGDVDGGTAGGFEFELQQLAEKTPAILFYHDDDRRYAVRGSIEGEQNGAIQFRPESPVSISGPARMIATHESGGGRAFRVNVNREGEQLLSLNPLGHRPVETFGEARRVDTDLKLTVEGKDLPEIKANLVDVSRSGGGFIADQAIPDKGTLQLSLSLPSRGEAFSLRAKLIWSDEAAGGLFRAGCQFQEPNFEFKAHLHDFLAENRSQETAGSAVPQEPQAV